MSYTSLTMEQGLELEDPQSRIRTLTEKGAEGFSKRSEDYTTQLNAQWAAVENLISTYSSTITNLEYLDKFERDLSKAYADYCSTSADFAAFLTRTRTEDSIQELQKHSAFMQKCKELVNSVIDKISEVRGVALENASRRSKISQSKLTHISSSSSQLARSKAKAEAAKARLDYVQQETSLLKQQAAIAEQEEISRAAAMRKQKELEAELKLLNTKQEVAATKAEAEALENEEADGKPTMQNIEKLNAPIDPIERTTQYINEQLAINQKDKEKPQVDFNSNVQTFPLIQPYTQVDGLISPVAQTIPHINVQSNNNQTEKMKSQVNFNSNAQTFPISQPHTQNTESVMPNRPNQVQDFTKFLLKKDLLISRLTRFDDQPQTFIFWKAQFEEIMKELEATNTEELDLLAK